MDQQSMKQTFMMSAVRVIARDGLVKATTKAIAAEAGLNEALIYRCFSSKNELLSEATTQWTFEQIYSFVVPNVRAEVLGEEGKEEAI